MLLLLLHLGWPCSSIEWVSLALLLCLLLEGQHIEWICTIERWSTSSGRKRHLLRLVRTILPLMIILVGKIVYTVVWRINWESVTLRTQTRCEWITLWRWGHLWSWICVEWIPAWLWLALGRLRCWYLFSQNWLTNEKIAQHLLLLLLLIILLQRSFCTILEWMVCSELAFLLTRGVSLSRCCQVWVAIEHIVEDVTLVVLTGDPADVLEVPSSGCLRPRVEILVNFV